MGKRAFLAIALLLTLGATRASAETRIALVIGNANYAHAPRLANPANDASAVAAALRAVGFTVTAETDLGKTGIEAALHQFAGAAAGADVALVYYAGHGMEMAGTNYLVPVDASLASSRDVDFEAVPLDLALRSVEGARHLRLVVLDACRNNPFAAQMAGSSRALGRGLARVEPESGTLVAYAAKAGTTADDGTGNSPFAAAFARDIKTPGLDVRLMLGKVHDDVMAATQNQQEPFVYGALGGEAYYFVPPQGGAPVVAAPQPPAADPAQFELSMWNSVSGSNDAAQLNAYLRKYPNGAFADIARAKIDALSRPAPQANVQVASIPPAPAAPGLLTAADFQTVLGLSRNSTLADAVRLYGQPTAVIDGSTYYFVNNGVSWLYLKPGEFVNIFCEYAPPIDRGSPVGRMCATAAGSRPALLSGFEARSGGTWFSGHTYIDPTGSIYVKWNY